MSVLEELRDVAGERTGMRLLIAFEDEYRAYGGAITVTIRLLRPHLEVETIGLHALAEELDRFAPQAVISSRPEGPDTGERVAWIELPTEPSCAGEARLRDRRFDLANPSLDRMIELIDEAERLL